MSETRTRFPIMLMVKFSIKLDNAPVHRAATNDIDFRIRAARGTVSNGLLSAQRLRVAIWYISSLQVLSTFLSLGYGSP